MTLTDIVTRWRWFRDPWTRRLVFGGLIASLCLLTLFPQRYEANVKLAPRESSAAGLGAVLGQLGGNGAALGGRQPVEVDLTIARSFDVQQAVVRRTGLVGRNFDRARLAAAIRRLEGRVTVRAQRANIIEIVASGTDEGATLDLASVYARAVQERLTALDRAQVADRRTALDERMREAADRLARAQAAVAAGRSAAGKAPAPGPERLLREQRLAQASYDGVARHAEGAASEELDAEHDLQVIEQPHLEPGRQLNQVPLALLAVLVLIAAAAEFHQFRPAPGRRSAD